ncbi:hypothetical protein [Limosilactobacillus reuteri]|uniref:hypothetical protein n=1 Tax=Limosilactobacillus reuteri TaxID=1598 RepID=UPI003993FAF5
MEEGNFMKKLNLERIKHAREVQDITLQKMADSLNLAGRASYMLKEQGKRRFYANEVPIICAMLNLTFDDVYTEDDE